MLMVYGSKISDAIRRYGVSSSTTSLIVVKIGPPSDSSRIQAQVQAAVSGTLSPMSELQSVTDWAKIRKVQLQTFLIWLDRLTKLHSHLSTTRPVRKWTQIRQRIFKKYTK